MLAAIATNSFAAGISLCMIVKDEESFLDGALESIADIVDELCIVDTGSTDRTREIARAYGARVRDVVWQDDFALARNAALDMATRRWIIVLDADERLNANSRAALAAIGTTPAHTRGKWISCRNLTDNCKGSGAMTNALVRIFPNDPRIRYRNSIHEFVALDAGDGGLAADRTSIEIIHHGYLSRVVAQRQKSERNLRLSRIAAERDPSDGFHQYNLGMATLLAGDRPGAISALERMMELTRDTPRGYRVHAFVALAELYAEVHDDVPAALRLVAECLRLVPNYSNAHYLHGKLLVRTGDLYAARDAFGRAIVSGASDREHFVVDDEISVWKAHSEIGSTLMHERRFAEALAWFELAARDRPAAQPLVINRAKCHEMLGDLTAAGALFEAAFDGYRDEASAVEWINFLLRCGRTAEAVGAVDIALPLVDDESRTLLLGTAAAAHLRAGNREGARATVERALRYGGRTAAAQALVALASHLAMPELCALVPSLAPSARAKTFRIAYVS